MLLKLMIYASGTELCFFLSPAQKGNESANYLALSRDPSRWDIFSWLPACSCQTPPAAAWSDLKEILKKKWFVLQIIYKKIK